MPTVIEDVARDCRHVRLDKLIALLRQGVGRADVYDQWREAQSDQVKGSPQLFMGNGPARHNPGVKYRWTAPADDAGFPRFDHYDDSWPDALIDNFRNRCPSNDHVS